MILTTDDDIDNDIVQTRGLALGLAVPVATTLTEFLKYAINLGKYFSKRPTPKRVSAC